MYCIALIVSSFKPRPSPLTLPQVSMIVAQEILWPTHFSLVYGGGEGGKSGGGEGGDAVSDFSGDRGDKLSMKEMDGHVFSQVGVAICMLPVSRRKYTGM